jgi:hypothetical protein
MIPSFHDESEICQNLTKVRTQKPVCFSFSISHHFRRFSVEINDSAPIKSVTTALMVPVCDTSEKNACLAHALRLEEVERSSIGRSKASFNVQTVMPIGELQEHRTYFIFASSSVQPFGGWEMSMVG